MFAGAVNFLSAFSAQKSHVKPRKYLKPNIKPANTNKPKPLPAENKSAKFEN
jgi:hypothetical protein